jgi:hypothetical protein
MTALIAVPEPADTADLAAESSVLVLDAQAVVITDEVSHQDACAFGNRIKAAQKSITAFFGPRKARWNAGHKAECEDEKKLLAPTEQAEVILKTKITEYRAAEAMRMEEERRQREAVARKLEEERRLQEALDAEADGDAATVDEILATPIESPIVALTQPAPKIAGAPSVRRWTFEERSIDIAAIIRHIAGLEPGARLAHPELVNLLTLDSKTTRQLITAMRDQFRVPGIRAYQADSVSFGSK